VSRPTWRHAEAAEDLNARVCPLDAEDDVGALRGFIAAEGVNHPVLRHQKRGALARPFGRSLVDEPMLAAPALDVHLIAAEGCLRAPRLRERGGAR